MRSQTTAEGRGRHLGQTLVDHLVEGVAVNGMGQRLTHPQVRDIRLRQVDHHESRAEAAGIEHRQLLGAASLYHILGGRIHHDVEIARFQAGHAGLGIGHGTQHHLFEMDWPFPVLGVAGEHDVRAAPPFLEDEGAGAHRIGQVVLAVLFHRCGRDDHAGNIGQHRRKLRRRRLHGDGDVERPGRFDLGNAGQISRPSIAQLGIHQPIEVRHHRCSIAGRVVMKLHARAQRQLEPGGIGRRLEFFGELGHQLALLVDVEQRVIDREAGLLLIERGKDQRIETGQVVFESDAERTAAHRVLCHRSRRCQCNGRDRANAAQPSQG